MKFKSQKDLFEHYKKRFQYFSEYELEENFVSHSRICIVIPCFIEPDLQGTLHSLAAAERPKVQIEVIIVVNAATDAKAETRKQNTQSIEVLESFQRQNTNSKLSFHLIKATNLPPKKAGVGLARKIGMDEAFRQFAQHNILGHIICLDADCTVSKNYLVEAEKQLAPNVRGGHFFFEHKYQEVADANLKNGIIQYELHLRYHNQGLKFTGFPYAEHTVGSCMIVRSDVYALLGGMNQRKAGEDFYFMNKVYTGGDCIAIKDARVFPSARISARVPFGTGKAQGEWIEKDKATLKSYNPEIYFLLKLFISKATPFEELGIQDFPAETHEFIKKTAFLEKRVKSLKRSKNELSFQKNLFSWLDAFYLLKFVHHLRDAQFESVEIGHAARILLSELNCAYKPDAINQELLEIFRALEK